MNQVPKYHELMWPVLKALKALGGSANLYELLDKIVDMEKIPEEIQEITHREDAKKSKLAYNMGWTLSYLKIGGLVVNSSQGVWAIEDKGED